MNLTIPEFALVVLIGASGSGKSTFARAHFKATEVISSDFCRSLVADDENDQSATPQAFEIMRHIVALRLAGIRLTVVDATNVQPEARKEWLKLAKEYHCLPVAIVFNLPERLCQEHNRNRTDRQVPGRAIAGQIGQLRRSLRNLEREGFRHIHVLTSPEEVESASIAREPLFNNRRSEHGPLDIIGDVHGCYDELLELLVELGYGISVQNGHFRVQPPEGHRVVFVGDLVDRGPKIVAVLKLAMSMVAAGTALCVPGNHDIKLMRALQGKKVRVSHGLAESLTQLESESVEFRQEVADFIYSWISHYVFDDGKLVVAHSGMKAELQGRASGAVREFGLYGETTGETDEFGLPVRHQWAADYRGAAMVVYGHTPVPKPEWLNRTINIDTGCVFGGALTSLRYPSRELVSVPAHRTYSEPARPFLLAEGEGEGGGLSLQQQADDVLDIDDVIGKRIVDTRLYHTIRIAEGNAIAALEVMSRFAADPRWLIYLPPTMSPSGTSSRPDLLEHPTEAFAYYRSNGVARVVCEEKHMGSRAVAVICRDQEAARRRFGTASGTGICYTRTGRRFFEQADVEGEFLARLQRAVTAAGYWDGFNTDWVCLDCELMPWSAKAQELLQEQYAAVGSAAGRALAESAAALGAAAERIDVFAIDERFRERADMVAAYIAAYRRYCWSVHSVDDLRLAPFHLLATEGKVHLDRDHVWHMETLARLAAAGDRLLMATPYQVVELDNPASEEAGAAWWEELTSRGGEGVVVKPLDFVTRGPRGLVQPAVKCRGREYLRIIYGPEYTAPENLARLRARNLRAKQALALKEFALGVEALERFVQYEPLRRVHECVFGVLALESEPVDPRL